MCRNSGNQPFTEAQCRDHIVTQVERDTHTRVFVAMPLTCAVCRANTHTAAQAATDKIRQQAEALWPQVARAINRDNRVNSAEDIVHGVQQTVWEWNGSADTPAPHVVRANKNKHAKNTTMCPCVIRDNMVVLRGNMSHVCACASCVCCCALSCCRRATAKVTAGSSTSQAAALQQVT